MFHSEIFKKIQQTLDSRFRGKYSILDIGCGEAFGISKFLFQGKIKKYFGIDNSETALSWAEKNLKKSNLEYYLLNSDFNDSINKINGKFEVIIAGYSFHHLKTFVEKKGVLQKFFEKLTPNGVFIIFDLIKNEQESLEHYHSRYIQNCKENWKTINQDELKLIASHIMDNDYPLTKNQWKEIFVSTENPLDPVLIETQNPYYILMVVQKRG